MTTAHRMHWIRIAALVVLLPLLAAALGYVVDGWIGAFYVGIMACLLIALSYCFNSRNQPH